MSDVGAKIRGLGPEQRAKLEAMLAKRRAEGAATIPRRDASRPPRLSFAQQRLWFLDRLEPGSPLHTIGAHFRVTGPLDERALAVALAGLVARHEALRARFEVDGGRPVAVVEPSCTVPITTIDVTHLPAAEREGEGQRLAGEEARRPFDLQRAPLLRVTIVRLAPEARLLLLTVHHIVSDGWSMGVLFRDLSALHDAASRGQAPSLPPLPIGYFDFAAWQRERLSGERLSAELAHAMKALEGAPALLHLPTDRPRPAIASQRGGRVSRTLSADHTTRLEALSRREGVTLFTTLLAAYQVLLHRRSGDAAVVVGTPVAGRLRTETEGLVGLFVHTLALRTDLADDPTFRALLLRVHAGVVRALGHQELPFERLVEALAPARSLAHAPVFQALFVLQNAPSGSLALGSSRCEALEVDNQAIDVDVALHAEPAGAGLALTLRYATDLFDRATAERMLDETLALLAAVAHDPAPRVSRLPWLDRSERQRLVSAWNQTRCPFARDAGVHERVAEVARRTPTAVAVRCGDERITYAELVTQSRALALRLTNLGVKPEVVVGVAIERSVAMVTGMLAVLEAGGAYLPLDPSLPPQRIARMLEDARAAVILTDRAVEPHLLAGARPVLRADEPTGPMHVEVEPRAWRADPESLAYAIYTSGSTGGPKGVMVPHRALAAFLDAMTARPGLAPTDTLLAVTSVSFDIAALELWLPLSRGATVEIASRQTAMDPHALARALGDPRITALQATPATYRMLTAAGFRGRPGLALLCGGEPLTRDLADALLAGGSPVYNLFGPTETTIWSSVARVMPASVVSIGLPIDNTTLHVLDGQMEPCPIGVPGELYIGGEGLARGYLGRPAMTAERFVPSPFGSGERLYRTGDRARRLASGEIDALGRLDHQVKLRGHRIELGEIEGALRADLAVSDAVVTLRDDGPGGARLVAHVVLAGDALAPSWRGAGEAALRRRLELALPAAMIPSDLVVLDRLPLTTGGKVDRSALPAPRHDSHAPSAGDAPADLLERSLLRVWERVLGRRPLGVHDAFFDVGGHSLLAVELFAQMAPVLGRELPLATLFEAPTVRALARVVREASWRPPWQALVTLQPGGHRLPFYCVHPVGGHVLVFRALAGHLGADQPFYALQSPSRREARARPQSIPAMAADYVAEILRADPVGPYLVGGYSLGGLVAFEMAHALRALGREVRLVALLDASAPGYPDYVPAGERVVNHLREVRALGARGGLRHTASALGAAASGLWPQHIPGPGAVLPVLKRRILGGRPLSFFDDVRDNKDLMALGRGLVQAYEPRVYPGAVTLFRAEAQPPGARPDATSGWGRFAEEVRVRVVPGAHRHMMDEPHAAALARELRSAMDEAAGLSGLSGL